MTKLEQFLRSLHQVPHTAKVFNPYHSSLLRNNLKVYLSVMQAQRPQMLLVGEALGYRGGRLTGIPFTSEYIVQHHPYFGASKGYQLDNQRRALTKEQSATIMWQTIESLPLTPLLWNAYPFHPHQEDRLQSNRPPTTAELLAGQTFLNKLIDLFEIQVVVAVGNKASHSLIKLGFAHSHVRHPAYGGKVDFTHGLFEVIKHLS